MNERWGFNNEVRTMDQAAKSKESSEIDRLTHEFKKAGGKVDYRPKLYTREQAMIQKEKDKGKPKTTPTYATKQISWGDKKG